MIRRVWIKSMTALKIEYYQYDFTLNLMSLPHRIQFSI